MAAVSCSLRLVGCRQFYCWLHCTHVAGYVTFDEFAEYIIDKWSSGKTLERHWRPQYQICRPCYVNYDFIGRVESISEDAKHVLSKLTASDELQIKFPSEHRFNNGTRTLKSVFANVSQKLLRKLIALYRTDYDSFGYDYSWALRWYSAAVRELLAVL